MLLQLGHVMSTAPSHSPTTVSLADEEAVKRILVDTLFGLWATVNNLSRLRPSRHDRYRVTVFGSARPEPGHWVYEEGQRSGGYSIFSKGTTPRARRRPTCANCCPRSIIFGKGPFWPFSFSPVNSNS